ncbi:DUF3024 domain-containing protein [Paenibacillus barcinonensis]|uniref:DUF3024 domain-containing protein n=1 Tax=Paenibacillus barcinonensis TaxID=198119 RepID=A0A2V4V6X5_PAEBA|nr:DUF3024 domain-containing protein [Paenibacillus barcinonensis]PYE48289.1 hypothetical protein DFQ00_109143 [Paenibacillus barcinonensis]QKS56866.1 DUF3024 domain-containing protein [Paenibacillus barcinonensis]
MLDVFTQRRIESLMNGYVHEKVPAQLRTMVKLTYELKENELILTEERPRGQRYQWERMPIARFYWEGDQWKVYASDDYSSWSPVEVIVPCPDFEDVLEQVERDESGVFWRERD